MIRRSALVLLPLVIACGESLPPAADEHASAILFGENVRLGDFPSVGFIAGFDGDESIGILCTASLIAEDTVLTAAHCLEEARPDRHAVYFARELTAFTQLELETPRWAKAATWTLHPDYVPISEGLIANDLALIFLETPQSEALVSTLADDRIGAFLHVGAPVLLVGYGRDETGLSGVLRKANGVLSKIDDALVRTGGLPPAPSRCSGDSGAPTFMDVGDGTRLLISVNSYGFRGCESASTEARVDAYLEWITTTMIGACEDDTRTGCAIAVEPRHAPREQRSDAGVNEAPSLGEVPDAGVVELSARTGGGCRCVRGDVRGGLVFAVLIAVRVLRRRKTSRAATALASVERRPR